MSNLSTTEIELLVVTAAYESAIAVWFAFSTAR
jgi:hypothetical protein